MTEQIFLAGAPVTGFDGTVQAPSAPSTSPWTVALVTSVVSAATSWVVEEVAQKIRKRRR